MRRLPRAAGLLALAPTLAMSRAPSLVSTEIASFPLATVVLDLGQEAPARELALDIRVDPAKEICGPGKIEINGHTIETSHWEIGKADLKTKDGVLFAASWKVECETVDDEPAWQSIDFRIDSYDGKTVDDAYFVASLRQVEPVNIADFDGTLIRVSREGTVVEEFEEVDEILGDVDPTTAVEAARIRLEELRRLQELREIEIAELEMFVVEGTEAIGGIAEACGGKLKCLVRSFLRKLTGAASQVYDKIVGADDEDFSKPHLPKHGNHSHHHHGNHTHGNHTWPHPPHRRPHWLPPFCRCPPRRPHRPHPPPGEPPHHGPPPPLPPSRIGDGENVIAPDMPASERPFVFDVDGAPPPLFHVPEPPPAAFLIPTPLKIFGILFIFFSICGMIHRRRRHGGSCAERRRRRRARREAWRQRREERRAAIQRRKEEVGAFLRQLFQRVSRGFGGDEEKQSSFVHTVVQPRPRAPSNASNTSSNVSTTMEQDLARFREAASMVTDMVAAEEGRARQRAEQRRLWAAPPPHPPPPMSPGSAFPDYVPQDEFPPAYEIDLNSGEDSVVADGFRYTPGSSEYTPSTGSDHSSSDELGYRKP